MEKNIISYRCESCNEMLEKHLLENHTKETDHLSFVPIFKTFLNANKKIFAFRCKHCGIFLSFGECGYHRSDTSHKEFEPLYE